MTTAIIQSYIGRERVVFTSGSSWHKGASFLREVTHRTSQEEASGVREFLGKVGHGDKVSKKIRYRVSIELTLHRNQQRQRTNPEYENPTLGRDLEESESGLGQRRESGP